MDTLSPNEKKWARVSVAVCVLCVVAGTYWFSQYKTHPKYPKLGQIVASHPM